MMNPTWLNFSGSISAARSAGAIDAVDVGDQDVAGDARFLLIGGCKQRPSADPCFSQPDVSLQNVDADKSPVVTLTNDTRRPGPHEGIASDAMTDRLGAFGRSAEGSGYLGNDLTISAKTSRGSAPSARTISKNSMRSTLRFPASYPDTTDCGLPSLRANST
jgi:hypothetical protein